MDSVFLLLGVRKASVCLPDPPPLPPRGQGWPGQALGGSPGEKEVWGGAARTSVSVAILGLSMLQEHGVSCPRPERPSRPSPFSKSPRAVFIQCPASAPHVAARAYLGIPFDSARPHLMAPLWILGVGIWHLSQVLPPTETLEVEGLQVRTRPRAVALQV